MTTQDLSYADYTLVDAAWFTVGKFAVRVGKTDEGVRAAIYRLGKEDEEPLASCEASNEEAAL